MSSYYSYAGLGAPCYGCNSKGVQATNPTYTNKSKLASKYGWTVRSGGKYPSTGDKQLALDIYCFQHIMEQQEESVSVAAGKIKATDVQCGGKCDPNTKMGDCYNRDGMLGKRTLQHIGNALADGQTIVGGLVLGDIVLPAAYKVKQVAPAVPDDDVRPDILTGTGPAAQRHALLKATSVGGVLPASTGTSWALIIGLGLVAAGAIGYYQYENDPVFRTKIKKMFG